MTKHAGIFRLWVKAVSGRPRKDKENHDSGHKVTLHHINFSTFSKRASGHN